MELASCVYESKTSNLDFNSKYIHFAHRDYLNSFSRTSFVLSHRCSKSVTSSLIRVETFAIGNDKQARQLNLHKQYGSQLIKTLYGYYVLHVCQLHDSV